MTPEEQRQIDERIAQLAQLMRGPSNRQQRIERIVLRHNADENVIRNVMRDVGLTDSHARRPITLAGPLASVGVKTMTTSNRVAQSYKALTDEIDKRMSGMPKAVNNGERLVPVTYDVTVTPMVDDEEIHVRNRQAYVARREALAGRASVAGTAALRVYTHAQQSDDGIGLSFMTPQERDTARIEWGNRLRAKVEASKREDKRKADAVVLVDIDWWE